MCGICGVFSFNDSVVEHRQLKLMADSIAHRGPDGEGFWVHQNSFIGFGHRRLSIIDLSDGGKQPMQFADGRYTITFNGEIYNYLELKQELIKIGFSFNSDSDTEVLLALFHQKREKCLQDLDGMFAFAIWDEKEQQLFCSRDRFGEKPFFIYHKNNRFVFASEIKAFWALGIEKQCEQAQLFNYVGLGHLFEPQNRSVTLYEGVTKLEAGHYLLIDRKGNIKMEQYWTIDPTISDNAISFEEACEQFKQLFTSGLKRRLRSDVPVGSSLSGGLDSSLIVCAIDELNSKEQFSQNTFSARFANFEKDETEYMLKVINKVKAKPHYVFPDEAYFINTFDKMTYHIEEPFASPSVVAQYAVMESAKQNGVTVLLDGQGADELLAGYSYMFYSYFLDQARHNPINYFKQRKAYNNLHPVKFETGRLFWLYAFAPSLYNVSNKSKQNVKLNSNNLLTKDYINSNLENVFKVNSPPINNLNLNLYDSINSGQLEDLLKYADRNAMAHSREIRLPFLNHKLVEFAFTLPTTFKINRGFTKYIMRKSFESILPREICWRVDKVGYETPQAKWMANKNVQDKIISDLQVMQKKGIVNKDAIDNIANPTKNRTNTSDLFRCWVASKFVNI